MKIVSAEKNFLSHHRWVCELLHHQIRVSPAGFDRNDRVSVRQKNGARVKSYTIPTFSTMDF